MTKIETAIPGLYLLEPFHSRDQRGTFTKIFSSGEFQAMGLEANFKESYYSFSQQNVIRGMHFQVPPFACNKLVYVTHGCILDVVLDLRRQSPSFGQYYATELSADNFHSLYIPAGLAHGFRALESQSLVVYLQSAVYSKDHDAGVRWDSFGFDWGCSVPPIQSERDSHFPAWQDFDSPFTI